MQWAASEVFPCSLRCSLISISSTYGKSLKVLRVTNSGTKWGVESPLYTKFPAVAVMEGTDNVLHFLVCFSRHFVAFENFSKDLMPFCAVGRGLWQHRVNIFPGLQYQSNLLSYGLNLSQEKISWYQELTYLGRSPVIAMLLSAAASFSFWL